MLHDTRRDEIDWLEGVEVVEAPCLYTISHFLVTFADWPAEFIIGQSQGDITAVINIRITRSTKRQNTISDRILVAEKYIYIERETSIVDMITKKTIPIQ